MNDSERKEKYLSGADDARFDYTMGYITTYLKISDCKKEVIELFSDLCVEFAKMRREKNG